MNDTIAAISTALGNGSISIIRVSGKDSIEIVNSIFEGKNLILVPTHTINYGHIVDNKEVIDEVLVSIMKAPKTFTTEDVVEINCHGGIAPTNKVFELLIKKGVRIAEPGEFTKRAFLNGRIDLVEAEGIMDLIEAKTETMRKLAISRISGNVSKMIKTLRQKIVEVLAQIEVNIDYPEYEDIEELTHNELKPKLKLIQNEISKIIEEGKNAKIINEGIKTSIVGKPNVGKSSLLNNLLEEEKAIVTNIPGTTRDTVEGIINIEGILLNIIDTAGIRNTEDIVEIIGVNKSYKLIDESELVLFVLNNNEKLTEEDKEIYEKLKSKKHIVIINKNDLERKLDIKELKLENIIYTSTINNEGIEELKRKIKELFNLNELNTKDLTYLTNARSLGLLEKANNSLIKTFEGIEEGVPVDIVSIDIKSTFDILGEITGESYSDELIDQLFSQFCLGK
jgi:tRNA modification GTPase TrmE